MKVCLRCRQLFHTKTIQRGEPPIRPKPTTFSSSIEQENKRSIMHALVPADVNGNRPVASEQTIHSYNGFHSSLDAEKGNSKAYFHMSYNQPPYESGVNDVIAKLSTIINTK